MTWRSPSPTPLPIRTRFEFKLVGRSRHPREELDPFENPFMWRHRHWRPGREVPSELFRFGIEFSDGATATNLGGAAREADDAQPGPVLDERGGRGGGGRWEEEYWVWPLPPPGRFAFVYEWPAMGIPLTRTEIDASLIRDAAERAETLWEDASGSSPGGRWRSFGPRS